MDIQVITQLISGVGFPIVAFLLMFKHMEQEEAEHKAEVDRLSSVLEGNTNVLTRICEKLDRIGENNEQ